MGPLIVSCLINKTLSLSLSLSHRSTYERGDQWRCVAVVALPRSTQLQCQCLPLSLDQRMSLFLERNSISLWPMLIASRFLLGLVFVLELVCWNGYGDCLFEGISNGGFEVFREKICWNLFGFVGCGLCVVRDEKLMCCVVLFLLFFVFGVVRKKLGEDNTKTRIENWCQTKK